MKKLFIILIFLSGCGTIKDKLCDYQVIPQTKPINLDPGLFVPCQPFIPPVTPLTYEEILNNLKTNKLIHEDCINKNYANIVILKHLSNNP